LTKFTESDANEDTGVDFSSEKQEDTPVEGDGDGDEDNEGEKRKRKRKRVKAEKEEGESSFKKNDSTSGNTISGGSGKIIAETAIPAAAAALASSSTVYIEGIPYEATESDVREFFKGCGSLKSIRLPTWQDTGRLRGYGHLEFGEEDGANEAYKLDGTYLKGRYIKVDKPKVPKMALGMHNSTGEAATRPVGCKQVFVKNIPYDCDEEGIKEVFKVCGPIEDIRLARWGHTNQLKGFCYVSFKREDSCDIAVKKSGVLSMKGRPLLIDFETGAAKGGYKRSGGAK